MTKLSDQFQLDVPLEDASWACREAVARMDWHLDSIEPHRLVLKRGSSGIHVGSATEIFPHTS